MHIQQFISQIPFTFAMLSVSVLAPSLVVAQTPLPNSDASTSAFIALCKNQGDVDAQNFCFGFGEGVYQSHVIARGPNAKPTVCIPKGLTRDAVLLEFLTWTQARPQYNSEFAAKTILRFFTNRFPCAKSS